MSRAPMLAKDANGDVILVGTAGDPPTHSRRSRAKLASSVDGISGQLPVTPGPVAAARWSRAWRYSGRDALRRPGHPAALVER
jgi:hypothetical protein